MSQDKQLYKLFPWLNGGSENTSQPPTQTQDKELYKILPWLKDTTGSRKPAQDFKDSQLNKLLNLGRSTEETPAAPAKPANKDKPLPYGSLPGGDNPDRSAAQPGAGPKGNEVGSDSDPDEPGLQGPGDPKGPPTGPAPRVNANGLLSYGKDLSSLNTFSKAWLGDDYEIADIKSAFQSNDLEGAYQNGSNSISTEDSKYTLDSGATPSNVGGKYAMDGVDTSIQNTGYKIDGKSVPGTVGGNPANPQDGTSDKPDVAEKIRQVRMARSEGSPRGFNGADFSGDEPDNSSLVSPMYANKKRNEIRSTFLDYDGSSVKAAAAANAKAHYGKDSNGDPRFNYGGELVYAKEGMAWKAKDAAMKGLDPTEFLDIPTASDTQPDTPAASELSVAPQSEVKPGTITAPENTGGSLETTAPITKPSPEKFQEAQDFLSNNMQMLNRRTK